MVKVIDADVLVIGGGGAAARAALEARQRGATVAMVMKGQFGKCGA
ncbi:MAG: FAD-binding protein, partial [Sphingomonadaceae bacterium]